MMTKGIHDYISLKDEKDHYKFSFFVQFFLNHEQNGLLVYVASMFDACMFLLDFLVSKGEVVIQIDFISQKEKTANNSPAPLLLSKM